MPEKPSKALPVLTFSGFRFVDKSKMLKFGNKVGKSVTLW